MKKYIPHMSLPWNLKRRSGWSKKFQLYCKNYDFCEYVKFGVISLKIDIFVNNCLIKVQIYKFFCTYVTHIFVIIWCTLHFVSTESIFS